MADANDVHTKGGEYILVIRSISEIPDNNGVSTANVVVEYEFFAHGQHDEPCVTEVESAVSNGDAYPTWRYTVEHTYDAINGGTASKHRYKGKLIAQKYNNQYRFKLDLQLKLTFSTATTAYRYKGAILSIQVGQADDIVVLTTRVRNATTTVEYIH